MIVYDVTDQDREELRAVLVALREVVEEAGSDYQYPGDAGSPCFYVVAGRPSCLVGRVLHKLGVPLGILSSYENSSPTQMTVQHCGLHGVARVVLANVQGMQDARRPWGEILNRYTEILMTHYGVTA